MMPETAETLLVLEVVFVSVTIHLLPFIQDARMHETIRSNFELPLVFSEFQSNLESQSRENIL